MEVLGIDIGFGFTKATDGKETLIFKSLFGDATDLQFWVDFGEASLSNYFNVTIDGKSYFIGDLAEQQSNVISFTLDQEKLISEFVKVLTLTVAGVFLKEDSAINVPINIVSGLPIGYFKHNHKRFNEILTGHHKISYIQPDGSKIVKEIYINKVRMLPQPLGTILNLLMDDRGKIVNKELAEQKVGVVDIGFRTTDFTIMDRLRYIDRSSRTMDTGISKAFGVISNKLREKCGVSVELYRLYKAAELGTITMKGHGLNFAKIRDQVYAQLAGTIANDIDRVWAGDWDIDTIILTGGGCMELAKYLQPLISGNVIPTDMNVDARLNNVQGYLKYGRYIWGESFQEPPQSQPPQELEPVEEPEELESVEEPMEESMEESMEELTEKSISEVLEEIDEPIEDIDDFVDDEFP
ncbi:MAG: ParM/StbA family protein [Deltaproteobacteria bacterium]|nr:ParM/StbA family protein [Deltaproteobacteria bacterium]MBW2564340.1 ParM/StbA family protein [Deltaproteobacteria bacterium]